ncbi:PDZ domain-containing protein [bacterium]|nr:PDZ domain-containing protein [bacterium]
MKFRLFVLVCLFQTAFAQEPISYSISFDNAVHHEASISVTFPNIGKEPLELYMSRSSPGRYALHEFVKNVYDVKATDGKGKSLALIQPDPYSWRIENHNGTVTVTYTLFADLCDGTYSAIDGTHAHLNIPATYMWAKGMEKRPIRVQFKTPKNWKIATQLKPTEDPLVFTAPDFQYFMDSPVEMSNFDWYEWTIPHRDRTQTIRMAFHHSGTKDESKAFFEAVKAIVLEAKAVFGELPEYDNGTYTFLADYLPYAHRDGMEHRNSTVITNHHSLQTGLIDIAGSVSHEFFHCWNVERIRPKSLEPFDFLRANMSGELWFAEGFTSYYDALILKRAAVTSLDQYTKNLSKDLSYFLGSPGRRYFNAVDMSRQAPFADAATSNDPQNKSNTFISYYNFGAVLGLALDLSIREKFPDKTLDDLMREMWSAHGKNELPYTNDDVKAALAKTTRDQKFADMFFEKYIFGRDVPDFGKLLSQAGLLLRKSKSDKPFFGPMDWKISDNAVALKNPSIVGSPLYKAGLDQGDKILTVNGEMIAETSQLDTILAHHQIGDTLTIEYEQRTVHKTAKLILMEDPVWEIVTFEKAGQTITQDIEKFRKNWLTSRSSEKLPVLKKYCPECKRSFDFELEFCGFDGKELGLTP